MFATIHNNFNTDGREPRFEIVFANGESYPISTRCLIDLSEEIDYALDEDSDEGDEGDEGNFLENLANAREIDDAALNSPLQDEAEVAHRLTPVFVKGKEV